MQCMPCSSQIISEMLPVIQIMENRDFLRSLIHFQIFNSLLKMKMTTPAYEVYPLTIRFETHVET